MLWLASVVGIWSVSIMEPAERRRLLGGMAAGFGVVVGGGHWARMVLRPDPPAPSGPGWIWAPPNVRWWALALLLTLMLGLVATSAVRGGRTFLTRWSPLALGAGVLVAANAAPAAFAFGLGPRPPRPSATEGLTRLALAARDATTPEASIAVVWAGMIPYFARRPAIDLLGRSDRTIARTAPRAARFWPGHTKWNYAHSIGRLRPDLILQLWMVTPEDLADISRSGYDRLAPNLFVRADSTAVDRAALLDATCRIWPGRCSPDE
jgi:hypothetical protein